jgi:hypothetical protein
MNTVDVRLDEHEYHEVCNLLQLVGVMGTRLQMQGQQPDGKLIRSAFEKIFKQGTNQKFGGVTIHEALDESVKLQSHYAKLLNMYDSGERMQFATAAAWIARLNDCRAREREAK